MLQPTFQLYIFLKCIAQTFHSWTTCSLGRDHLAGCDECTTNCFIVQGLKVHARISNLFIIEEVGPPETSINSYQTILRRTPGDGGLHSPPL
jgi:hypothetical protein